VKQFSRGEVWLVDLGIAGKVRPALVVSVPPSDTDRALVTLVSRTTSARGTPYEVDVNVPFLRPGVFDCQGVASFPLAVLIRPLGRLKADDLKRVEVVLAKWLGMGRSGSGGGA
jgi:mRNA interferase MazF